MLNDSGIVARYIERTAKSKQLAENARALMPSGVSHDGRLTKPYPIYVERALGPEKWDVDGNHYIDYFGGHGSLLLGHCFPGVVEAVSRQMQAGTHFGACHPLEVEWAQLITSMVPSAENVRFTSSGTEATLMAIRVARAYTSRSKLLRIKGHFHGWHDHMTSGYASHFDGTPTVGVLAGIADQTVLVEPDDIDGLEQAFAQGGIAAAIVEPTGAHFGRMPLDTGFLKAMRDLCTQHGTVLIFDEVVTGFRVAPGGYQSLINITPDITTLAKVLAGGLPGGALTGRRDILSVMDVERFSDKAPERVAHQGTFNGSPVSAAAGVATLAEIKKGKATDHANRMGERLRQGLNQVFTDAGVAWHAYGDYSGFNIFTNPKGRKINSQDFDTGILKTDLLNAPANPLLPMLRTGLLSYGVDINAGGSGWVSATHTETHIDATLVAMQKLLADMKKENLLS